MVTVIIPAHNEAQIIEECIKSLLSQSYKKVNIIISCDNCTDETVNIARRFPVTVYETKDNKGKRSGAINQAIANTNALNSNYIVAFDADSTLEPTAIEMAVVFLSTHPKYVSTCSFGKVLNKKRNFLTCMQNIEYGRFNTERIETQGRILVSHGLCSMFRTNVLKQVLEKRGYIYDETNIIEDYELTQCLKHMGHKLSVYNFHAYTDIPEDFTSLYSQRKRWVYGSLTVLKKYPITRHNILDRVSHLWAWFMILVTPVLSLLLILHLSMNYIIIVMLGINAINTIVRLKYATWKDWKIYVLGLFIIPEMVYNLITTFIFIVSYYDYFIKKKLTLKNDSYS